jgi:hypothetical protein
MPALLTGMRFVEKKERLGTLLLCRLSTWRRNEVHFRPGRPLFLLTGTHAVVMLRTAN